MFGCKANYTPHFPYWRPEVKEASERLIQTAERLILTAESARGNPDSLVADYLRRECREYKQECEAYAAELRKRLKAKYDSVINELEQPWLYLSAPLELEDLAYFGLPEAVFHYVVRNAQTTCSYEKYEEYIRLLDIAVSGGFPDPKMEGYGYELLGAFCFDYGKYLQEHGVHDRCWDYFWKAAELNVQDAIAMINPGKHFADNDTYSGRPLYQETGFVIPETSDKVYRVGDRFVTEAGIDVTAPGF